MESLKHGPAIAIVLLLAFSVAAEGGRIGAQGRHLRQRTGRARGASSSPVGPRPTARVLPSKWPRPLRRPPAPSPAGRPGPQPGGRTAPPPGSRPLRRSPPPPASSADPPAPRVVMVELAADSKGIHGRFKNTSDRALDGIRVDVFVRNVAGTLLRSATADCLPDKVAAGSPGTFEVAARNIPAGARITLDFKSKISRVDESGKGAHQ